MTCEDVTLSMRAREKLQERNLELEALNDLIAPVSTSLHLPQLLKNMKRIFAEKLEIDAGCILFCSGPSNKFNAEVLWGVPDSMRTEFETFALHCYRDGIAIYEGSDVLKRKWLSPSTRTHYGFQQQEWKGYLCISLLEKGETQGIAFLVDKNYERFGDDQVAFYRAVGEHITVATQNARLFERVRESELQMKAVSQRLVNVQEAERRYVARELHDEIGQVLTGLNLALEMHTLELGREPTARLLEAKSTVHKLVAVVRELSLQLRPSILDDLGLFPALRWYFERFYSKTNICVLFEHEGADGRRFAIEVETAVYRIVQEALTNVARHAKVNEVAVRLWCEDKAITVQVEDHGLGFDLESALRAGRTGGLRGMKERALVLRGHFTVETKPGSGTCLTAELPTGDEN
jgi:signal transduction histidine kinase